MPNGSSRWNGNYGTEEKKRRESYDVPDPKGPPVAIHRDATPKPTAKQHRVIDWGSGGRYDLDKD